MRYSEGFETGNPYREAYLASINKLISSKESDCRDSRKRLAYEIMADKALGLEKLKATLGWPLTQKNNKEIPCVRQELVSQEDGYCVYRMQIEVFPDFWFYGNFFKHTDDNVRPFVISQHGGDGSPELCSGMLDSGTGNYNRMTERILSHGINVFAPQLLLWKEEIFNLPNNRKSIHAALEGIGGTITALEVFCIQRTIDYFEAQAYVDKNKIGMAGLSYGGMYTTYTAAIDSRIKAALCSSFFINTFDYPHYDWSYRNASKLFSTAELALLIKPRKIFFAMGDQDELFPIEQWKKEFEYLKEYDPAWQEWTNFEIFKGGHEFCPTNQTLNLFLTCLQENPKE